VEDDMAAPFTVTRQSDSFPAECKTGFDIPVELYFKWAEHIEKDLISTYSYGKLHDFIKPYYTEKSVEKLYAFPILKHGQIYGMMVMTYCYEKNNIDEWKEADILLMQGITQIISNAIEKDSVQKNLVKAKEQAETADKLKSMFLANMSHEIRTPMSGIVGFSHLIQDAAISPEVLEYAQVVMNNCYMLLQLLDDIIDVSKLESGQLKIRPKVCNINQLLSDRLILYQELLKKNDNTDVVLLLDDNGFNETALVDPVRLQQVLTNLVSNAIKFTEKGYIRFGYTRQNEQQLLFYVKDSGVGIPANDLNDIFDRFKQVEEHQKFNLEGTGIGLSISRSLVELMGGTIWIESELGVGSSFYFTIKG
jgi:signal transduction histidine kinase